jgi:benzoyl-CoA reductase/2-hydroxyglutaryl-CoA dehydratase subunit BcrC/BadD/HgdB
LHDNWLEFKKLPYMDVIYFPRKATEDALQMYLIDLERWRERLSEFRGQRIRDNELKRSIALYNHTRELMQQFYELRKRERPPVTGVEALEVMKASGRMPREQYNALLEQLLMIVGNDVHNSNWIAALEELDAVVVTDEMITVGTRCFWGKVDTSLPPMEGIARHYMFNRPQDATIYLSNRYDHIFKLAKEYKVDGVVSDVIRYCAPLENDKPWLKKENWVLSTVNPGAVRRSSVPRLSWKCCKTDEMTRRRPSASCRNNIQKGRLPCKPVSYLNGSSRTARR